MACTASHELVTHCGRDEGDEYTNKNTNTNTNHLSSAAAGVLVWADTSLCVLAKNHPLSRFVHNIQALLRFRSDAPNTNINTLCMCIEKSPTLMVYA